MFRFMNFRKRFHTVCPFLVDLFVCSQRSQWISSSACRVFSRSPQAAAVSSSARSVRHQLHLRLFLHVSSLNRPICSSRRRLLTFPVTSAAISSFVIVCLSFCCVRCRLLVCLLHPSPRARSLSSARDLSVVSVATSLFAVAVTAEDVLSGNFTIDDVVLPLPGSRVLYPANDIAEVYNDLATKDSINLTESVHNVKEFSVTSMTGSYRRVFQRPKDYEWELISYVDRETLSLELSKSVGLGGGGTLRKQSSGSVERTHQSRDPEGCTYQSSDPEGYIYQSSDPEGCTYQSSDPEGCTYQSSDPEGCTYQSSDLEGCTYQSSDPEGYTYP
ncbi:pseudouridylate synthase 7-like protein isoform X2 [Cucumis melo var. makuwa]|uniref:Pseudouridylate synthase 7-like protein isoform X2 n=1 Tax=Cucumis melo var. makuwa TaxID=1194695 RepID=A0A5A7VES9_CUCMM|nr:pseudouridylate synthase 7-like protein isoform X2 [Cucumis melo var. makuwa]